MFIKFYKDNELESKLLEESDSPTDRGKDIFEELLLNKKFDCQNRLQRYIFYIIICNVR